MRNVQVAKRLEANRRGSEASRWRTGKVAKRSFTKSSGFKTGLVGGFKTMNRNVSLQAVLYYQSAPQSSLCCISPRAVCCIEEYRCGSGRSTGDSYSRLAAPSVSELAMVSGLRATRTECNGMWYSVDFRFAFNIFIHQ